MKNVVFWDGVSRRVGLVKIKHTWRHIPEDIIHSHHSENLKYYKNNNFSWEQRAAGV
jgi:hypothetical protein